MHETDVLTENGIMDAWNGPVNRNELWVHEIVKSVGEWSGQWNDLTDL